MACIAKEDIKLAQQFLIAAKQGVANAEANILNLEKVLTSIQQQNDAKPDPYPTPRADD